ncbi:hypothetical protein HDV64DRAFT_245413 [Trichoderma sp. TUCIM 5745]
MTSQALKSSGLALPTTCRLQPFDIPNLASISLSSAINHQPVNMVFEHNALTFVSRISFSSRTIIHLRPRPRLGSLAVPAEIILAIIAYLDRPSLLSFALTCRTFFLYYFPQPLQLSSTEKNDFLVLLEKDAPQYYFCHLCLKLHRWRMSWFRHFASQIPHYYLKHRDTCREKYQIKHNGMPFFLLYPLARVIMNRHFYGAAHGPRAQVLSTSMNYRGYWGGRHHTICWRPRIIGDELILSSDITIYPNENQENPRNTVDCAPHPLCPHLTTSAGYSPQKQLPELAARCSTDCLVTCHESIKSCPECLTDYCITITQQKKRWVIKVTAYNQLGAVRSPFDWEWSGMVRSRDRLEERQSRYLLGHRPGMVRHLWSKADKVFLEPTGDWAYLPG